MKRNHNYANRLMTFFIKLSVCFLFFPVSFSSAKNIQVTEKSQQLRMQVRDIYTSQVGVREKGMNAGPVVEQYLRYVKLSKGNPWCAAFVCWVFGKAGIENPRSGWSPDLFKSSKVIWSRAESGKDKAKRGKVKAESREISQKLGNRYQSKIFLGSILLRPTINKPIVIGCQPGTGDVFGIYFPEKKRIAHVGFIDHWDGTWLISVEGNTNASGSNEGDGVYRKRRLVKSIYRVARYINH